MEELFDPLKYRQQKAQSYQDSSASIPKATPEENQSLAAKVYKPLYDNGVLTQDKTNQSFVRKVGEDALTLGLVPAALAATAIELANPIDVYTEKGIKQKWEIIKNTGVGFYQGVKDMFSKKQWVEHPLMNAVNTVSNISIVGGLVKSAAISTAKTSAISAAKVAALESGASGAMVDVAMKSATNPLKAALMESSKIKSFEPATAILKKSFLESGLADDVATSMSKKITTEVIEKNFAENATKLKVAEAVAHPIKALGENYRLISEPVQKVIFGSPEKSAVGKLYGSKVVEQNIKGYSLIEEWAGMQTMEKGWKNTVENRVRTIQDWVKENPDYAALTPEERIGHFENYAKADIIRQRFAGVQNRDYTLTKSLPKDYTDSMVQYVDSLPSNMNNSAVITKLAEHYGNDFSLHNVEVSKRLSGLLDSTDRTVLNDSIRALSTTNIPVSIGRLSKAETSFMNDLEGSGYRIGKAPKNKPISQAIEVTGFEDPLISKARNYQDISTFIKENIGETIPGKAKLMKQQLVDAWNYAQVNEAPVAAYTKENLLAARTTIGNLIDKLGISPNGVVEGTQNFMFRESFTQGLFKEFAKEGGIVVNEIRYPLRSIMFRLEKMREILNSGKKLGTPVHSVSELRVGELEKFGFTKSDAIRIEKVIRESTVANPNIVGLGEAFSNIIRKQNNPLSRSYDWFMKAQSEMRFRKNPMFGLQSAVESTVWGNLWAKKMPGKELIGKYVNKIAPFKKNIIKTFGEPTIAEQQMVLDNVMGNYNRQLLDAASSPEIYRMAEESVSKSTKGFASSIEKIRFENRNLDSNIWLGAANFSTAKLATNMMKSYAERFGMTLEEALSYTTKNGNKVYNNEWLVDNMRSGVQGVLGYTPGLLTSPLIRTLNTIFFPIRFQTKTLMQTADWIGSLEPLSRLAVMNQFTTTANWLTTDEGKTWAENRGFFASLFNYTFAFEGIGKTVAAVTRGKLFGGNAGLIGGLPFGFVANIARDLGYIKQEERINPTTGMPYDRTIVDKNLSLAGFTTIVEDIILSMSPSMPFNTATGGAVTVSTNRFIKDIIEQSIATGYGAVTGEEKKSVMKDINFGKTKVEPEFRKKLPNPIFFLK